MLEPIGRTIEPSLVESTAAETAATRTLVEGRAIGSLTPGAVERWAFDSAPDRVWDVRVQAPALESMTEGDNPAQIHDLVLEAFGPDGQRLSRGANVDEDAGTMAEIWGLLTPTPGRHELRLSSAHASRQLTYTLWVTSTRLVHPRETIGRTRSASEEPQTALRYALDVSRDGSRIATGSGMIQPFFGTGGDPLVEVWSATTRERLATLHSPEAHRHYMQEIDLSHDGRLVVSASRDRAIALWDIASGQIVGSVDGHPGLIEDVVLAADGNRVFSAGERGTIYQWAMPEGAQQRLYRAHRDTITTLGLGADDTRLLSASRDGSAIVWDTGTGSQLVRAEHGSPLTAGAISPDGRNFATADRFGGLALWDAVTGDARWRLPSAHRGIVKGLRFSSDGDRLVSAAADGSARVWDVATRRRTGTIGRSRPSVGRGRRLRPGRTAGIHRRLRRHRPNLRSRGSGAIADGPRRSYATELSRHGIGG